MSLGEYRGRMREDERIAEGWLMVGGRVGLMPSFGAGARHDMIMQGLLVWGRDIVLPSGMKERFGPLDLLILHGSWTFFLQTPSHNYELLRQKYLTICF